MFATQETTCGGLRLTAYKMGGVQLSWLGQEMLHSSSGNPGWAAQLAYRGIGGHCPSPSHSTAITFLQAAAHLNTENYHGTVAELEDRYSTNVLR